MQSAKWKILFFSCNMSSGQHPPHLSHVKPKLKIEQEIFKFLWVWHLRLSDFVVDNLPYVPIYTIPLHYYKNIQSGDVKKWECQLHQNFPPPLPVAIILLSMELFGTVFTIRPPKPMDLINIIRLSSQFRQYTCMYPWMHLHYLICLSSMDIPKGLIILAKIFNNVSTMKFFFF